MAPRKQETRRSKVNRLVKATSVRAMKANLIWLSFAVALTAFLYGPASAAAHDHFKILLFGFSEERNQQVRALVKTEIHRLFIPVNISKQELPEPLAAQLGAIVDGAHSDEIRKILESQRAKLAVVLDDRSDGGESESVRLRLVGFPKDSNYPDFPTDAFEVPIVTEKSYVTPVLGLRVAQAVANFYTPDTRERTRLAALWLYAKSGLALDPCAPAGGTTAQLIILGRVVVPSQLDCGTEILGAVMFVQSTVGQEYLRAMSVDEMIELFVALSESLLLSALRNDSAEDLGRSIDMAERAYKLEQSVSAKLALIRGLIQRGDKEDFDRIISLAEESLPTEDRGLFLYYSALATALFERSEITGAQADLAHSLEAARDALRLQSPSAGIEVHLLLRLRLAKVAAEQAKATNDEALRAEALKQITFVETVSRDLDRADLAELARRIAE